jgi:hypothetical protein
MKIAKYNLNKLVKDAGGGLNSKAKGGVVQDSDPFHQKFGQPNDFTKIEIFVENQSFLARLDINEKMLPLTIQIFSKKIDDISNGFDEFLPEDL